jgi:hypothetical protein
MRRGGCAAAYSRTKFSTRACLLRARYAAMLLYAAMCDICCDAAMWHRVVEIKIAEHQLL